MLTAKRDSQFAAEEGRRVKTIRLPFAGQNWFQSTKNRFKSLASSHLRVPVVGLGPSHDPCRRRKEFTVDDCSKAGAVLWLLSRTPCLLARTT
jgi:hypothetical protein